MKTLRSIFHFLGGVYLALTLIGIAAIAVIIGTFLESRTGSHLAAAKWTYEHPLFLFILSLFFINILFAALRRWPFKKRHIPFLITHLGLLMVISGTIIKNRWGLQGQLTIWEGSGNQHLLLPHTYGLLIQSKEKLTTQDQMISLHSFRPHIYYPFQIPQLKCKIIAYAPHVKEKLETWIKGPYAYIAGFPPLPVHSWKSTTSFPEAEIYPFRMQTSDASSSWSIVALRTPHVEEALQEAYLQGLTLRLVNKKQPEESLEIPLKKALENSLSVVQGNMTTTLHLPLSFLKKESSPSLSFKWKSEEQIREEKFKIFLQGQDALLVKPHQDGDWESAWRVDFYRAHPQLCLIEDDEGRTFFFAFDSHGRIHGQSFSFDSVDRLITYEQGFSGYGVQATAPIPSFPAGREDKEKAYAYDMTLQLRQALVQNPPLSPPLQLLEEACRKAQVDFSTTFVEFLVEWNHHSSFLYRPLRKIPESIEKVLQHLNWPALSSHDKQCVQWIDRLLKQLEESWQEGKHPIDVLERHHWPFLEQLKKINTPSLNASLLNVLSQQVSSFIEHLPPIDFPTSFSNVEHIHLLSAYFRAYGIDYRTLFPYQGNEEENFDLLVKYWKEYSPRLNLQDTITFETPLSHHLIPLEIPSKLEDQRPGIVLQIQEGRQQHTLALSYDSSGTGLKWPILNGKYMIRFQPKLHELPYRVRLRQARQISYPQSQQVYSYESDVLISEKDRPAIEQTLSMNNVYETWDGYRLYLAGIGHSVEGLKRIQLIINHDPAKYFLTYPGASLVFLGMLLLFWRRSYGKT